MTCDEVMEAVKIHPTQHTAGMRAAVFKHLLECHECMANGRQQMKARNAELGLSENVIVVRSVEALQELLDMCNQDHQDPEFMEVLNSAKRRTL